MNKKRLLILAAIAVLVLGSMGVVQHLAAGNGMEESESRYVQNVVGPSEDMENPAEPSEDEQNLTNPSENGQSPTEPSEDDQNPTEPSESEEESTHVPKYADYTEDIGTYFDLDIDDMMELDRNVVEHAQEFEYRYDYLGDGKVNVDLDLFSDSVNLIKYADPDCHKVLLGVLSQYADDHSEDYSVFEMESYYKSMWVEEGFWGHKVLDTVANKTLYIAFASTGFEVVGYLYKVE